MMTQLKEFFRSQYECTEEELRELTNYFTPLQVSEEEILVQSDEICRSFYFINKGSLKACFINEEGQETIRLVAFENAFLTTIHSFITQIPTTENICACEKSEILAISHSNFQKALQHLPFFKNFYIHILERTYVNNHWRLETFLRMDAKQRYAHILEHKPQLAQRLSNKNLAYYIGITPESLSRIKARI